MCINSGAPQPPGKRRSSLSGAPDKAYARGVFEPEPGVVFDFCLGRGGKYPLEFLKGWTGTLVVDAYSGYDAALSLHGRSTAYCLAHYLERRFIWLM